MRFGYNGFVQKTSFHNLLNECMDSAATGRGINREQARELSCISGADRIDLFSAANRLREAFKGRKLDICSIVNAKSGACSEDCAYCAQSVHYSTDAAVYPLISPDRIAAAAESAAKNNARRFCIVTSGRGIDTADDLENIALGIVRVREAGLSPCATLGTLTRQQLARLRDAGLERYHHNIETSRSYFTRICTSHTFDARIEVLRNASALGLSACSGGILGMGECMDDRIDMAFTLRDLDVDSIPLNFLMPVAGTPLADIAPIAPLDALHAVALFRFILPSKEIRICGGRGSALRLLHPLIFLAGADGFMIGNYLTRGGLNPDDDLQMIRDLGFLF